MRGRGYIYSIIILFVDLLFSAFGGMILAAATVIYVFTFGEWLGRRQMGAVVCNPSQGEKQRKLNNCFERVKTKAERSSKYIAENVRVYYIPGEEINAYAFGRRSIGVTEGALNLDTRTVEALIAHEYGHIVNGDSVLNMVMAANCFGIAILLACCKFAFLTVVIIIACLFFGTRRFSLMSCFMINKIISLIRWAGDFVQQGILHLCEVMICLVGRKGELLADEYACHLGYGYYLKNFLIRFSDGRQRQSFFEVLYSTHPSDDIRIANISTALERQELKKGCAERFDCKGDRISL